MKRQTRRRMIACSGAAAVSAVGLRPFVQASNVAVESKQSSVIYIFLSGGLGQQDSFDPKPEAALDIRGEFAPIDTATPGIQICEHLPMLSQRSERWSLVRSLTHPYNEHSQGHMVMLSGRTDMPVGFSPNTPRPSDHPSIAAITGALLPENNGLPSSIVLPEKLIHRTGRVIPGQFAGVMGAHRDPWMLEACRFNATSYGAWPEYEFDHQTGKRESKNLKFNTPSLALADGVSAQKYADRLSLLEQLEEGSAYLKRLEEVERFDRYREKAASLLGDGQFARLFDVHDADERQLDRYGRNTFGWSLLMARRLVSAGVRFVQVNLGNNETWDTHGNAFPHLKNFLMPPFDRCVSALLDDLQETGELDSTLIVIAGEFGRTPRVFRLPEHYALPGRDHHGAVQTVFLAGGGIRGGTVVGSSDRDGGQPETDPQTPEALAATMYQALGIPRGTHWYDLHNRPMPVYNADPIG